MTLIRVTVKVDERNSLDLIGEQLGEHFAVTPTLTLLDDGTHGLRSGLVVIHRPTGRALPRTQGACIDYREFVDRLYRLGVDWSATSFTLDDEQKAGYLDAFQAAGEPVQGFSVHLPATQPKASDQ